MASGWRSSISVATIRSNQSRAASRSGGEMAIVGIIANQVSAQTGGNIVGMTQTVTHTWMNPSSIWGQATLRLIATHHSNASANAVVTQTRDAQMVWTNVFHIAQFADNCTGITYAVGVTNADASILCITEFLA